MIRLVAQGSTLDLSYPRVVGILNVTPDSFSDGGAHNSLVEAVEYVNLMISAGATIVDVGGESTRPGATEVSVEEELTWAISVAEVIVQHSEVWISVDTSRPEVIRESARTGAHIINDICSLAEPGALQAAAEIELPVCLMYMQGQPKTTQKALKYEGVSADVECFFAEHIVHREQAGIAKEKSLFDPGFDFSKNLSHSYQLLARLGKFHHFRLPLLVSVSRKSMMGWLLNTGPSGRLNGSLACAVIAAMQDMQIIHVHGVREVVEVLHVVEAALAVKGKKRYE